MKAYLVERPTPIDPFGEPAAQLEIGARTLRATQLELLEEAGLSVQVVSTLVEVPVDETRIVLSGDLFFTRRVLKGFLRAWRRSGWPLAQVGLPEESLLVQSLGALQRFERREGQACFDLWGVPAGATLVETTGDADRRPGWSAPGPTQVLGGPFREIPLDVPIPRRILGVEDWRHPVTSSVCLHIEHWVDVLQANRFAVQIRWVDTVVRSPLWSAWLLLKSALPLPGRGAWRWRLLAAAVRKGRGVDIHPTARVEGCLLEDGVKIGAHAIVRASVLGAGTVVEERATVAYSVLGPENFVSKYTVVYSSAAMSGANLGMSMQMCLVGRDAATTPRATPMDVIPGGEVRVRARGRTVTAGLPVLGCCVGHRSFLGADVLVAPGRAIPNDVVLGPSPQRVLSRIPQSLEPGAYRVENGGLKPA